VPKKGREEDLILNSIRRRWGTALEKKFKKVDSSQIKRIEMSKTHRRD